MALYQAKVSSPSDSDADGDEDSGQKHSQSPAPNQSAINNLDDRAVSSHGRNDAEAVKFEDTSADKSRRLEPSSRSAKHAQDTAVNEDAGASGDGENDADSESDNDVDAEDDDDRPLSSFLPAARGRPGQAGRGRRPVHAQSPSPAVRREVITLPPTLTMDHRLQADGGSSTPLRRSKRSATDAVAPSPSAETADASPAGRPKRRRQ
jgi:hypothetical protein